MEMLGHSRIEGSRKKNCSGMHPNPIQRTVNIIYSCISSNVTFIKYSCKDLDVDIRERVCGILIFENKA